MTSSVKIKPKFCINCKYFISNDVGNKYGKCMKYSLEKPNYLGDGIIIHIYPYFSFVRENDDLCGKDAKHYEEKKDEKNLRVFINNYNFIFSYTSVPENICFQNFQIHLNLNLKMELTMKNRLNVASGILCFFRNHI